MGNLKVLPILALLSIIVFSLVTRISLFNPNALYFFSDEVRFDDLVLSWRKVDSGEDFLNPLRAVFKIQARPGYGIFFSFPAYLESKNPAIAFGAILNILINTLIPLLIFLIVKKIDGIKAAILASIFVACSISSIVYIRHMLPYDLGLTFMILAVYIFSRTKSLFLTGLVLSFSYLTYPGYLYYLFPIPILIFLFKPNLVPIIRYLLGFALPIIIVEVSSRLLTQTSYIEIAKALSGTVMQGDFIRASTFIKEYILLNDGYLGLILSLSALLIIFIKNKKLALFLGIYLIFVFLILEIASDITHKTVLYGRTIRPFYLLLLISAATILSNLSAYLYKFKAWVGTLIYFLIIVLVLVNFWPRYTAFKNSIYPRDFDKQAKSILDSTSNLIYVLSNKTSEVDKKQNKKILAPESYYIVNTDLLYPYYGNKEFICKKKILIQKPYILSTTGAYLFEGFSFRMRFFLVKDPPAYQLIYCKE